MKLELTQQQDKELNELTAQLFEIQRQIAAKREQIRHELMETHGIEIGDKCTVEIHDTGEQVNGYVRSVIVHVRDFIGMENRCFVQFNKERKSGVQSEHRLYGVKSIIHIHKQPTNGN